jgi:hypothetical protein
MHSLLAMSRFQEQHSSTYTVDMGTITLSVEDDVLAAVRRLAAVRNSTVNAMVREYLTSLAGHDERAKRARVRLRELSARSQGKLGTFLKEPGTRPARRA